MSSRPVISKKRLVPRGSEPTSAPLPAKLRREIAGTFHEQARREAIVKSGKSALPRHLPRSKRQRP